MSFGGAKSWELLFDRAKGAKNKDASEPQDGETDGRPDVDRGRPENVREGGRASMPPEESFRETIRSAWLGPKSGVRDGVDSGPGDSEGEVRLADDGERRAFE